MVSLDLHVCVVCIVGVANSFHLLARSHIVYLSDLATLLQFQKSKAVLVICGRRCYRRRRHVLARLSSLFCGQWLTARC